MRDLFKEFTGKTLSEATRIPSVENSLDRIWQEAKTKHPALIRTVASGSSGDIRLTEEDRESHVHILGSPGEGKSKFLEMMVSMDIDALISGKSKAGACFIDSSDNGATMRKVLKYCARRGFEKVFLIDPHNIEALGYVPPINPLNYKAPSEAMQGHIADSMRVLWQTKDFSDEAIITTYLPYVVDALHSSGMTLTDSEAFTFRELSDRHALLLGGEKLGFRSKLFFNRVFAKEADWREFQSTCRRLNPFYHSVMQLILGSVRGVNFQTLIADGWIILANLYPIGVFEERHQRLLGTIILNEIVMAMSRIRHHEPNYNVPYYIYIDEFAQYATRKVSFMLYNSRKSGLLLNLAHQGFGQIEDKQVLAAIKDAAKTKVLFYVANPDDRHQMVRQMYGGELSDRAVEYTLSQTKKQNAVIKINKHGPELARIRDWPDADVSTKELQSYILHLYQSNPQLYRRKEAVEGEITDRFASTKIRQHSPTPNIKYQADAAPRPQANDTNGAGTGTPPNSNTTSKTDAAGPSEADIAAALEQRRKGRKR